LKATRKAIERLLTYDDVVLMRGECMRARVDVECGGCG
jgi:hypothetical protein